MEDKKFVTWVKAHKTELIIAGVAVVGTVLVVRNWDSIVELFKKVPLEGAEQRVVLTTEPATTIPDDVLENLTGNMLTATALGSKVGVSNQQINKRIVEAGLATKLPCGEYKMTEAGSLLGQETTKIRAWDHTFRNIEWDEKVLEVIFSPEELFELMQERERVRQIVAG